MQRVDELYNVYRLQVGLPCISAIGRIDCSGITGITIDERQKAEIISRTTVLLVPSLVPFERLLRLVLGKACACKENKICNYNVSHYGFSLKILLHNNFP